MLEKLYLHGSFKDLRCHPVKRRWDGSYPYTFYPHLYKVEPLLHISIPPAQMLKKSRDLVLCMVASGAEILAGV